MEIREATENDIDGILSLQPQIYRVEKINPDSKEALEKQLLSDSCSILVAEKDGKIVATSVIYYIMVAVRNQPYALFEGLVVDESQRGQGTGSAMLKEMIDIAKYKNCYKIIFTSGNNRTDAHKFYEKIGFKKWGLEFRMDL